MSTTYDLLKYIKFHGGKIATKDACWTAITWRNMTATLKPGFYQHVGKDEAKIDKDMKFMTLVVTFGLGIGLLPDLFDKLARVETPEPLRVNIGMDNLTDSYAVRKALQVALTATADKGLVANCQISLLLDHEAEIKQGVSSQDASAVACKMGAIYTAVWEVPYSDVKIVAKAPVGSQAGGTTVDISVPVANAKHFTGDRCGKSWVFTLEGAGGLLDVFLLNDISVTVPESKPDEERVLVSVKSNKTPTMFATGISFADLMGRWAEIADLSDDIRFGLRTRNDGGVAWEWDEE